MAAKLVQVAPRTVEAVSFPSYAPTSQDLEDLDMELLEEYALNDDDLDFLDGTNISEDTAGPNSVSDLDDDGTGSDGQQPPAGKGKTGRGGGKKGGGKASSGGSGKPRKKSQEQMERRRERNRILARRTRLRKKFFFESLQKQLMDLKRENSKLKTIVRSNMKEVAPDLLRNCNASTLPSIVTESMEEATSLLDRSDFNLIHAMQLAKQSFVVTDPSLPDNPIVFASQGFLEITGYRMEQVLGRNCRFLQGPDTAHDKVAAIRRGVETGADTSVCLLNYRADGTPFWNQFFVAPLRDLNGDVVYYVGAQCVIDKPLDEDEDGEGGGEDEEEGARPRKK